MKHPLRTLLLAVCCGLAAACTQPPVRETRLPEVPRGRERLKLMSYNIRNGIGIDNIQDIGRIARVILREAPDLVALQELDSATLRVDGRYIPGELGRMTGMHATFGRAIGFAGGSYGIGLLSRTEPLAVRSIPLPGREEARVLLMAEFPDYTVCITHLSLTPEDRLPTRSPRSPAPLAADHPRSHRHMPQTGAAGRGFQHRKCRGGACGAGRRLPDTFRHHADDVPVRQPGRAHRLHPRPRAAHVGHGRGKRRRPYGHGIGSLSAVGDARLETG